MKNILSGISLLCFCIFAFAGGNPEYVKFPDNYKSDYTKYETRNRSNGQQLAVLYANSKAIDSASAAALAEGSSIIMEIYKVKTAADGSPLGGVDGLFEKDQLAAIAVMEKRSNWDADFDAAQRTGDWGYAIYNTDGTAKTNDLDCVSCHTPMPDREYLFSHSSLLDFAKNH